MSPQDKVERVLKEIHVAFSKSETYNGHPDKVIIDRKQFLNLLDRLNQGIYDMMDQYEQTRQSRSNAERAFRKKGDEIIEAANANAEDVYAASVIYTADMIGAIRELMDHTNDSMNDLFLQFRKDLREQKDKLQAHENELQGQLADLTDTKKYLSIIDDINKERARKKRDLDAERETGVQYAKNMIYTPPSSPEIKVNEQYFENSGTKKPEDILCEPAPAEKPDIKINTNAAPPFSPHMYGNFHTFPSPTAHPADTRINPRREPNFSLSFTSFCIFFLHFILMLYSIKLKLTLLLFPMHLQWF